MLHTQIGWLFPICWLVGAFLPLCTKDPRDRRAAIGSAIMFTIYIIIVVLAVAIPLGIMAQQASTHTGDVMWTYNGSSYIPVSSSSSSSHF